MKTKNLFQLILILTFCIMNQFVIAQCQGNKVLVSNTHNCCETKCVSPNQVNHYLQRGWVLGPPACCMGARLAVQTDFETQLTGVSPNPVTQSTTITFTLAQSENISVKIFDMNGKLIAVLADKTFEEGDNQIVWDATTVNAGIYFMSFQSPEFSKMEKLVVTKS
jgi:hypothetical protein